MPDDYFKWSEYVAEVKKLLPIEANRVGIGNTAGDYLDSLIVQAVLDLQRVIPSYRLNHETIYHPSDMVREGLTMKLIKPPQSSFRGLSIFKIDPDTGEVTRYHGEPYPYADRFNLINGVVPSNDGVARYSIADDGRTMYVYPMPEEENWFVSMFWDGQKFTFGADDRVPFPLQSALAVSYFVKANTSLEVEDDIGNKRDYKDDYEKQKPKLYIDDKERRGS